MPFCRFVGHKDAKLSLILNCIDPGIGGVLFIGDKGSGKSTLARSLNHLLPQNSPFVDVPLNATEDALLGCVNIEEAVKTGSRAMQQGLLSRARGGALYIDDLNLLNADIANLILDARNSDLILVGTMNPEEGPVSPHLLDRFGMCAVFQTIEEKAERVRIVRYAVCGKLKHEKQHRWDSRLRNSIARARENLPMIGISEVMKERIVCACLEAGVSGHRADIALQRAAAAYAAFRNEPEVTERHLAKILPLVLAHRMRAVQEQQEGEKRGNEVQEHKPHEQEDESSEPNRSQPEPHENEKTDGSSNRRDEEPSAPEGSDRPGRDLEEIFSVGDPFRVRRFTFAKDRIERRASGRRTRTKSSGKGGRYVKSTLRPRENDLAVDATLRAAAPWQHVRARNGNIIIRDEDLRFKQRERKMGHLVIFVLDSSGSMGAKKRMVETKGAVLSLLMDCYQKRDRVSMIVFRKDRAEIVLPPTSSVELASRKLRDLPVGGKTPLGAGLLATHNLIRQAGVKDPQRRFLVVIISDGRANQSISGMPVKTEIGNCAEALRELRNTDYIVVDTEDKSGFMRADSASGLATMLGADYFAMSDLRAEYLAGIVTQREASI
ncbi:MAG: VWA domain-containing protein [Syntrophobacteraceae bacterium]